MAFLKYAKAKVQKPSIQFSEWDALRRKAVLPSPEFQHRTAQVILNEYDPSKYMLSHATIVASVDVEQGPGKLGEEYLDGFQVRRKYADYYVTPETLQFINNNNDAFERQLLMASFKSFVGAQSYVEHVQIPELSKGRIIDAAARDVGGSVYVDILIANELRHAPLIRAIKSGQLGTLSMGCTTSSTTCTKCGNVAEDETQLCPCIRFFKGSKFTDANGIERKVAELCGHYTDPSSVRFIEASWVANPAFKGAVIRNILSAEEIHNVGEKLHLAFSVPERAENDSNSISKAARLIYSFDPDDDFGQQDPPAEEEEDPIQKAVSDLTNVITNHAVRKVRDQINKSEVDQVKPQDPDQNDTLIRSAMSHPEWRKIAKVAISFVGSTNARRLLHGLLLHKQGGWKKVATSNLTGREILAVSRMLDLMTKKASMAGEGRVYRTVLQVGGPSPYENEEAYLAACRRVYGRSLTGNEAYSLLEKGRLFALGRSRS